MLCSLSLVVVLLLPWPDSNPSFSPLTKPKPKLQRRWTRELTTESSRRSVIALHAAALVVSLLCQNGNKSQSTQMASCMYPPGGVGHAAEFLGIP